ncbi:MAG: hypothetical protein VKI42_00515 [Synechococcaceae cyanobacterium]|nr:hypothetical protein [Synechococcaceae cyanobacterium]
MESIKAIETIAFGCRFRSRLEARWAVVLETLGITWMYEHEGFETEHGRYLPDFWLPDLHTYIEIKPDFLYIDSPGSDWRKLDSLCMAQKAFGIIGVDLKGRRWNGCEYHEPPASNFDSISHWGHWSKVDSLDLPYYSSSVVTAGNSLVCPECKSSSNELTQASSSDRSDGASIRQFGGIMRCCACHTVWTIRFFERDYEVRGMPLILQNGHGPFIHFARDNPSRFGYAIQQGIQARFEHGQSPTSPPTHAPND